MDKKPFQSTPGGPKNRRGFKNFGFIALIILFGLIIFAAYGQPNKLKEVPLSDVVRRANSGEISKITIKDNTLEVTKKGEDKPVKHRLRRAAQLFMSRVFEQM
jgi:hypothetical protein